MHFSPDIMCGYCHEAWELHQRDEEDIAIENHVMGYDGSQGCLICNEQEDQWEHNTHRNNV